MADEKLDQTQLKEKIHEKYAAIAKDNDNQPTGNCGCNSGCCETGSRSYTMFNEDYSKLDGYSPDADLNLGCGVPTEYAGISEGDTVLDLGSGAGNDIFVARRLTGENGRLIGVDMTQVMIEKARRNTDKLGYDNVEFRLGEIESIPVDDATVDVVISNCVLNLVPDKTQAFREMYRVLKPGAHFCVSDIVVRGDLPEKIRSAAELYAGCVAGAIEQDEYLNLLRETGFRDIKTAQKKTIELPDELLNEYLTDDEIRAFRKSGSTLVSATITGVRPG